MDIPQRLYDAYLTKGEDYQPRTRHFRKDGTPLYINRLILENTPYLLQHAHNPVAWYPWSEEAFEQANRQNKPIFLSIGYATCHWCHVMEQESFEDPAIAEVLNRHFIAIKVDRETHPDVDEIYMSAVMLISGRGGWPMSSFLTPEGKPFYGGTYYPPEPFQSLLKQISQLWRERPNELISQADQIAEAVAESNRLRGAAKSLNPAVFQQAIQGMQGIFDELQGGFGQAPKFPREPWLYLLLNQVERHADPVASRMLIETLDHMARGGIHDQIGGGFHRYATDYAWQIPHFEKMLYNQAHLSRIYLHAWRLTGHEQFRRVATGTLDYVIREMTAPEGGFHSATDADSEGKEGLFFTWTNKELNSALEPKEMALATALYGVTPQGNFEGRNILHLPRKLKHFAKVQGITLKSLYSDIDHLNRKLLKVRNLRIAPLRDDKIITAWNGMMITAFAQAAKLLRREAYTQAAENAAEFLWRHNRPSEGRLIRVPTRGRTPIVATLEDYAYFTEGCIALYDLTRDPKWLNRATELAQALMERFLDQQQGGFYLNEADHNITTMGRPRDDGEDNAMPSGSSVALMTLQQLWRRSGDERYRQLSDTLIQRFASAVEQAPYSYAYLLNAINSYQQGERRAWGYAGMGHIRIEGHIIPSGLQRLLVVEIDIPTGWHINSDQPLNKDLVATELSLQRNTQDWGIGPVTYPPSTQQTLAFQSSPISVFSGKIRLQTLITKKSDEAIVNRLPVITRLQACNKEICLPPEQITLWLSP
jgi:uncharacterized protein YyaL (SSP411 family)